MWGFLVHSHNVLARHAQYFLPTVQVQNNFYTSIFYQSKQQSSLKCNKTWFRDAEQVFNFCWAVKGTRVPSLLSSSAWDKKCLFYTSFSYSAILILFSTLSKTKHPSLKNSRPWAIWWFFPYFPISLPYFLMLFFTRQCNFKHKSSLPTQGPPGFPSITAAEKRDQMMIPSR